MQCNTTMAVEEEGQATVSKWRLGKSIIPSMSDQNKLNLKTENLKGFMNDEVL